MRGQLQRSRPIAASKSTLATDASRREQPQPLEAVASLPLHPGTPVALPPVLPIPNLPGTPDAVAFDRPTVAAGRQGAANSDDSSVGFLRPSPGAPTSVGTVLSGEVGFAQVASVPSLVAPAEEEARFEDAVITYQPRPQYTQEARELHIEGTVRLRVVFHASGHMEIIQVLQQLGYGLDEEARAVVARIRFTPARRNGHPIDEPGVVRVVFSLAY